MTDVEINAAVAEVCGWHKCNDKNPCGRWHNADNTVYSTDVPDYCNDLNAIKIAVETLRNNGFHYSDYPRVLFFVVTGLIWEGDMGYFMFTFVNANARQRAEAFLRTVGKWRE